MLRRARLDPAAPAPKFEKAAGTVAPVGTTETDLDADSVAPAAAPERVTPSRPRLGAWLARYWTLLALLGLAVLLSIVVQHVVYPALSWNRDEATYLWQV